MSRIIKTIEILGKPASALFDTGAMYSYVSAKLVCKARKWKVAAPLRVGLGGRKIRVQECCFLDGKIEGLDFFTDAVVVEDFGRIDGHRLDAIIGAATMEKWEIQLDPKMGTLSLEGLKRHEFTEY
ncbi:MAG: hypothetical protein FJ291_19575 [Planctomycetes bacterium]|nr:hypothetical protein [Planctomycetota bacterium]